MLSFIDCEKYPTSLLYLSMTLGPVLLALGLLGEPRGSASRRGWLSTIGSVPLFYYVAHIIALHALAVLLSLATAGSARAFFGSFPPDKPAG